MNHKIAVNRAMSRFSKVFAFLFLLSSSLQAESQATLPIATWVVPAAIKGQQIPIVKNKTTIAIYKKAGLKSSGVPTAMNKRIADTVEYMNQMTGLPIRFLQGTTIKYNSKLKGLGKQLPQEIHVSGRALNNLAVYVHEMGHVLGNSKYLDGSTIYSLYKRAVPSKCILTKYANKNHGYGYRNEEFAEVFSAYILLPTYLKNKNYNCKKAYDFMTKYIFPRSQTINE